jgi:hypothetical protein
VLKLLSDFALYFLLLFSLGVIGSLLLNRAVALVLKILTGYMVVSISYFLLLKLQPEAAQRLPVWILLASILIALVLNINRNSSLKSLNRRRKYSILLLGPLCVLTLLVPSSTLDPNVNSSFKYWHSANNDIFDGLCGAKSILDFTDTNLGFEKEKLLRERSATISLENEGRFSESWICGNSSSLYLDSPASLQYSNLALIASFTRSQPSMITFLFQSILNLWLLFGALSYFGKNILKLPSVWRRLFSFLSIFSHIYWVTFLNGHIGTLMVAAPLVYWISFAKKRFPEMGKLQSTFLFVTFNVFILLVYPYVIPILVMYAIGLFISRKCSARSYLAIVTIGVFLLFFLSWMYFADERLKSASVFRSWGSFLTPLAPLQYFGIIPGNIMSSRLLGIAQNTFQTLSLNSALSIAIFTVAILSPLIYLYVLSLKFNRKERNYDLTFITVIPLVIAITSQDSYFFYKTSYIFQFIAIGILIHAFQEYLKYHPLRSSILSRIILLYLTLIVVMNISYNVFSTSQMMNQNREVRNLASQIYEIPGEVKNQLISMEEEGAVDYISTFYMSYFRKADLGSLDTNLMRFEVNKASDQEKYVVKIAPMERDTWKFLNAGIYAPETESRGKFRWVSGNSMENNLNTTEIRAIRLNSTNQTVKQNLCVSLAEFTTYQTANFIIVDQNDRKLYAGAITKNVTCFPLEIPGISKMLSIQVDARGTYPSYFDRRRLVYRVWEKDNSEGNLF